MVKWLVDKCKADINLPTKNGHAPLHLACIHNNLEIVKWLVNKCKVDPNLPTRNGATPLQVARLRDNLEIVEWLTTKCKVDPNARTALQVEDAGVIKFLEEHFKRKKGKFGV